jgi:hypothetical protein
VIGRYAGLVLLLAAAPLAAQAPPVKPIKLTVHPAAEPSPALKYRLLPPLEEQTPGNAVLLYYRAYSPEWLSHRRDPEFYKKVEKWKQTPMKDLPRQELAWLETYKPLRELDLGARRAHCDWELLPRIRQDGISLLLPDMQGFRDFANLLALRARLEIAEGHPDEAVRTLQTGYALARDVGTAPLLITSLIGLAIANVMDEEVENLIQMPAGPNLYWALTSLPRPFVHMDRVIQGDGLAVASLLPNLKELEARPWSAQQVEQQTEHLLDTLGKIGALPPSQGSEWQGKLALTGLVVKYYPSARRVLVAAGYKPELVEAMPPLQVVLLYSRREFTRLQDNLFKWADLPYWQARPGLARAEQQLRQARADLEEGIPYASLLLPAAQKVFQAEARTDRRIAALRCVEAIRLYAAAHDGQLPQQLSDITAVPIPIDPVTGKEFEYQAQGYTAILTARPPTEGGLPETIRYELTFQR